MPQVLCKVCCKEFYTKPNHLKLGWGRCCSRICRDQLAKKGKVVSCSTCDKSIYKSLFHLKHSKSKKYFCSKSCQTIWRNGLYVGKDHKNWINGAKSYRDILKRSGIIPRCGKCKIENQLLLAVHHIDHNKQNNALTILMWLCHNCHYLTHHEKKGCSKKITFKILISLLFMVYNFFYGQRNK